LQKKVQSNTATDKESSRKNLLLREGYIFGLFTLSVTLFLSLISYSNDDRSFHVINSSESVANLLGSAGAYTSDILLAVFGITAFLLPLLLAIKSFQLFMSPSQKVYGSMDILVIWLRVIGFILLLVSATTFVNIHYGDFKSDYPSGLGGYIGVFLGEHVVSVFGYIGGTILLIFIFMFGLTVFADISWVNLIKFIANSLVSLSLNLKSRFARRSLARREQKKSKQVINQRSEKLKKASEFLDNRDPVVVKRSNIQSAESTRATKEKQQNLFPDADLGNFLPQLNLLDAADKSKTIGYTNDSLEHLSRLLELKLQDFGISAEVTEVLPGPVVTRFEIQPAPGVKVSRISALAKDLARSMAVISVRVVEVIPGKSVVGIEIPNEKREMVRLSEVLSSEEYDKSNSVLTLALGNDIAGSPVVADLTRMPHLLVAGTTGSGKSVGVNAMLLSLLFKSTPDQVKLILIDPKMLELSIYDDIPHLLTPVITDMNDAASGLRWCVGEMERRYKLMAELGVRNIGGFNRKITEAIENGDPITDPLFQYDAESEFIEEIPTLEKLPYIVVVIDEFADMMMIVGKKVEQLIARIAQKARAAGIHLILATQRPSVDVITGLIKANVPSRIAYQVSSKIDSRTILDQGGAEQLLGHGDMLYLPPGTGVPERIHGAFVDDHEVHKVVADWKKRGTPEYLESVTDEEVVSSISVPGFETNDNSGGGESDPLYDEAVAFVLDSQKASISSVQRKLRIGYNRAARLIEQMEESGVVSPMSSNGTREILVPGGR
jgi:S-DNA-T family DNA segregation ATPase FtsK/SpoIIIE|tara:strand:- start:86 stop:2419 length:2334 start_codon:yes stop_codon:yes gene_type:complete